MKNVLWVMVKNWWTTLVGFAGGAALYLLQAGIAFPETRQDWYAFVLAIVIGGLGLTAKSATTGSTPWQPKARKKRSLTLPAVLILVALGGASIALTVGLAGCTTAPVCRTTEQCLAYTQATITASRATAADLLVRQQITVATARKVQAWADEGTAHVTTARGFLTAGKLGDAEAALRLAEAVLLKIEAELPKKGARR